MLSSKTLRHGVATFFKGARLRSRKQEEHKLKRNKTTLLFFFRNLVLFLWDFPAHFLLKHLPFNLIIRQNLGYYDRTNALTFNKFFRIGEEPSQTRCRWRVNSFSSCDVFKVRTLFPSFNKRQHLMAFQCSRASFLFLFTFSLSTRIAKR